MLNEDLKVRSFRISEEVSEKLKHISENFDNQNAALESLIAAYEVQSAKAVLTERQTDISDYDAHLQAIQSAFLHSLEINENAERRIRAEFQSLLTSKDETIIMLQQQLDAAKASLDQAEHTVQEVTVRAEQEAQTASEHIAEYIKQAENAEAAKNAAERNAEGVETARTEAARKEIHDILHDTKEQLSESRTDALEAKGREKALSEEVKKLEQELADQKQRADSAEREVEKMKAAADMEKERYEVAKQKAVLEERNVNTAKIQELYAELNELRKELSTRSKNTKQVKPKSE